jgi:hypothetical protein
VDFLAETSGFPPSISVSQGLRTKIGNRLFALAPRALITYVRLRITAQETPLRTWTSARSAHFSLKLPNLDKPFC